MHGPSGTLGWQYTGRNLALVYNLFVFCNALIVKKCLVAKNKCYFTTCQTSTYNR